MDKIEEFRVGQGSFEKTVDVIRSVCVEAVANKRIEWPFHQRSVSASVTSPPPDDEDDWRMAPLADDRASRRKESASARLLALTARRR